MKKKTTKKVTMILLVCCLIAMLTACGQNANENVLVSPTQGGVSVITNTPTPAPTDAEPTSAPEATTAPEGEEEPTATTAPEATEAPAEPTVVPEATTAPTATPEPTATTAPTATSAPTATPTATSTPIPTAPEAPAPTATPTPEPPVEVGSNILVVYFSCTNTTKTLAEYVADGLDADIYEIVPVEPYSTADLNYGNSSSRSSLEMNDPNSRPAISGSVEDMSQYDIVFIGYPIWWGEAPRIVSTFMESYDFSGKTMIPFCTSASSNIGSSGSRLEALTSGADWLSGRRFRSGASRSDMISWVNGLGLDITAE